MAKGRHRKARTNPVGARATAAAGSAAVAGVAAVGALAVPSAHAAAPTVWDRVAACESSGRWHINTHNHYYGGLQFLQATWDGFGGRTYAPRADLARRKQQIAIARRVLFVQGPHAWPVCGKVAHLTRRNGGATTRPLPTTGAYRPVVVHDPAEHRGQEHHGWHAHPGRHPGHEQQGGQGHHGQDQHRARHDHGSGHRGQPRPRVSRYEVKPGDSLSAIAERFHVAGGWPALWRYNRTNVPHPNVILVGQILQIP